MHRKHLAIIGFAASVGIGLLITLVDNLNASEARIDISPAEQGTIVFDLIHPNETFSKDFDVNKPGKMFIEFDINSDEGAEVNYWLQSPSGTTILTTPRISSSTELDIGDQSYTLIPMIGSPEYDDLSGNLVYLNYGTTSDILADLNGSLALVKRGGVEGDARITFLEKQANVARKGASALIAFNNEPGIFYGDLSNVLGEHPTIPAFSISREDGLELKNLVSEDALLGIITDTDEQSEEFSQPNASFDIILDEKGTYQIWFRNDGPGNAAVIVKYIFREG